MQPAGAAHVSVRIAAPVPGLTGLGRSKQVLWGLVGDMRGEGVVLEEVRLESRAALDEYILKSNAEI